MTSQAEQNFLIRKLGTKKPLAEMRMQFYRENGGSGSTLIELQKNWLRFAVTAAGGTPQGKQDSDLWKQLNAVSGLRVSAFINDNRKTYYLNAS